MQGSFLYSNDDQTLALITNFYQAITHKAKGVTRTTRSALSEDKLQRVLVYGGKVGSKVKVAYREIWKHITRPAGDVFMEFDLSDSNVIQIKGVRIVVKEATQDRIRYRITEGFDASEK